MPEHCLFPSIAYFDPSGRDTHAVAADLDGTLLVSRSSFPYFFLLAAEAGSLFRAACLLLFSPLIFLVYKFASESAGIQIMIFVAMSGIPIKDIEFVARSVLPRFYAADVRRDSYRAFRACARRRVVVTANPTVMVEPFVRECLGGDQVLGTELEVDLRTGKATGFVVGAGVLVGEKKRDAVRSEFGDELPELGIGDRKSDHPFMAICKKEEDMWPFSSSKGPSGFSWCSTAEEVTKGIDGSGLTAIVTGASGGIGVETTRTLALHGIHVIMAVRNLSSGERVKGTILKDLPSAKIDVMELDLASLQSVRNFVSEFNSHKLPLNLLINNAGIMAIPFTLSKDGIEMQFATNHIGHFLLTHLLLENMKKTSRDSRIEGRIVNVSSWGHTFAYKEGIRFEKINQQSDYAKFGAYGQSKLANILHANELTRRFKEDGVNITANSLHPGSIATNLMNHDFFMRLATNPVTRLFLKTVPQGAATSCYVALHPDNKGVSGKYFSDSNIGDPGAQANDAELAKKLWEFSMQLIK